MIERCVDLGEAPRPQALHEDAYAVGFGGGLVDPF